MELLIRDLQRIVLILKGIEIQERPAIPDRINFHIDNERLFVTIFNDGIEIQHEFTHANHNEFETWLIANWPN